MSTPEQVRQLISQIQEAHRRKDKVSYAQLMTPFNFAMDKLAKINPAEAKKIEAEYRAWIQRESERHLPQSKPKKPEIPRKRRL